MKTFAKFLFVGHDRVHGLGEKDFSFQCNIILIFLHGDNSLNESLALFAWLAC